MLKGLRRLACGAIGAVAGIMIMGSAHATTITFDGPTGITYYSSYVEKGYQFTPNFWSVRGAVGAGQSFLFSYDYQVITLQRVDGAAFDLQNIDFNNADLPMQMSFTFAGGGPTLYTSNMVLPTAGVWHTTTFNFSNLLSVTWMAPAELLWDNVTVTSAAATAVTPIPPALLLFATALAGLGWLGRRRRQAAA